jgi:hypothetical protein
MLDLAGGPRCLAPVTRTGPRTRPLGSVGWSSVLSGTNPPAPIATRYQVIVDPACRGARRTYLGGIDHGGGGDCIAPALAPKAIKMETFPLRAGAYDERLTLTEHLSVLRARLTARLAVYGASIAPLRLSEPQSTPLSG